MGLLRCALHAIKPSKFELWDENFIGLDENQGRLFFTRFSDPESEVVLDCNTISRLELHPVKIRKKFQSRVEERLARLELYIYLNGTDVPRRISFYDILTHSGEDFEMARAQQWTASISALIGAFTPGKRAA